MSYDLTIWKQLTGTVAIVTQEILAAISNDEAHARMQRFDATAFVNDLQSACGGAKLWAEECDLTPFLCEICDFTGEQANWINVDMSYGEVDKVLPKLVNIAHRHGLVVYDFQTEELREGSALKRCRHMET